jgi:dephospho-CoA kinase
MIVLGLTGSIGMGKSTTAGLFQSLGVPVQDADAVVAALYGPGGAAVGPVGELFPEVVLNGAIDRGRLGALVLKDANLLTCLEALVHPLVGAARTGFLTQAKAGGADVAVLDAPLLFETGIDAACDAVVVVTAPSEIQRQRVLARLGMTADKLASILARQIPDADKRARADFVIDTSRGIAAARADVERVLEAVRQPAFPSRRRGPP